MTSLRQHRRPERPVQEARRRHLLGYRDLRHEQRGGREQGHVVSLSAGACRFGNSDDGLRVCDEFYHIIQLCIAAFIRRRVLAAQQLRSLSKGCPTIAFRRTRLRLPQLRQ